MNHTEENLRRVRAYADRSRAMLVKAAVKNLIRLARALDAKWEEKDHPRDEDGRFSFRDRKKIEKIIKRSKPIKLPKGEELYVTSELNTHLTAEEREYFFGVKDIGNYTYIFINHGFNNYVFIGKIKLK